MSGSFTPEQLQRLYDVSRAIHATLEPAEALKLIVREAVTLVGATSGSLALVNPTTGLLEIEASEGLPDDADLLSLRPNEGITGWVAHHGEPLRIGDVSTEVNTGQYPFTYPCLVLERAEKEEGSLGCSSGEQKSMQILVQYLCDGNTACDELQALNEDRASSGGGRGERRAARSR